MDSVTLNTGDMIFLTHNKISVATHIEAVVLPSCGAISTFIGNLCSFVFIPYM